MKIEHMREFVTLAKYLNYTLAAEHLFITQPVLSRHINALEAELGIKIFRRNTQNVRLTEVGNLFLERIQSILSEYDNMLRDVHLKDQRHDTELRIGIPFYTINYYLDQVPHRFMESYPKIKLTYLIDHPDNIINALKMDEVDLIVVANMPFRHSEEFTFYDVFIEQYNVLVSRKHPLAQRQSVTVADLSGETFLGVTTNYFECIWALIKKLCRHNGFEPNVPVRLNQLESVFISVEQGAGIFIEGQSLNSVPQVNLATLPLVGEGCTRRVSIVYKDESINQAVQYFIRVYDNNILQQPSWQSVGSRIPIAKQKRTGSRTKKAE